MRNIIILNILLILGLIVSPPSVTAFPEKSDTFDFTLTDGTVTNLDQYQDKPIVLDWTASWCGLCKENQRIFRSLYDDFKDYANFITLSYFGSGDTLDDVMKMKNSKPNNWVFGLDHTNYAEVANTQNADIWIMDANLNIIYSWDEQIISKSDFANKLEDVIGKITTVIISDDVTLTSDVSFENYDDEIPLFGLTENPLFIGFLVLTAGLGVLTVYLKRGK